VYLVNSSGKYGESVLPITNKETPSLAIKFTAFTQAVAKDSICFPGLLQLSVVNP